MTTNPTPNIIDLDFIDDECLKTIVENRLKICYRVNFQPTKYCFLCDDDTIVTIDIHLRIAMLARHDAIRFATLDLNDPIAAVDLLELYTI